MCLRSPRNSEVFSLSLTSLSPPPTPIAKRGRHSSLPANAVTSPAPMFFPKSQSVFRSAHHSRPVENDDAIAMERERLAMLASRPIPSLRLLPRRPNGMMRTNSVSCDCDEDIIRLPPLPFSFSSDSCTTERALQQNEEQCMIVRKLHRIKRRLFLDAISASSDDDTPPTSDSKPTPKLEESQKLDEQSQKLTEKSPQKPSEAAVDQQQAKLQPFRQNLPRPTIKRRNSFVARTA